MVRLLQEEGAQVRIVRTRSAAQFVTDTTLSVFFVPERNFFVLGFGES